MLEAGDDEHLAFASGAGRVVFTQDSDFLRLHAAGGQHAGIVYAPQQTAIGIIVGGLMLICDVLNPQDMMDHVEFLVAP